MGDRRITRKRKRNVLSSCVTPVYMNARTEKQLEKVQVCTQEQPGKNNRGSKRADKRNWVK